MNKIIRDELTKGIDEAHQKCLSDEYKMHLPRWERLLNYPIYTIRMFIWNRLVCPVIKFLYPVVARLGVNFRVKTFFGETMLVPFQTFFSCWVWGSLFSSLKHGVYGPELEMRLAKFILKKVEDDVVFFDVGANCGYYSLMIQKIAANPQVYAFEPDPCILKVLRRNLKDRITIVDKAVSEKDGVTDFYSTTILQGSISTLFPEVPKAWVTDYKKVEVESLSLDSFCAGHNIYPHFMKIDVEGGEDSVLKGAKTLLKNHSPIIAMEVWTKPFTAHHRNALEILRENGFGAYILTEDGEIESVNYEDLLRNMDSSQDKRYIMFDLMVFQKRDDHTRSTKCLF